MVPRPDRTAKVREARLLPVNLIPLLTANWRAILLGAAVLAIGGYVWSCERAKDELVASEAIARQQEVENAKIALRQHKAKERADENYERRIADLTKRLRQPRPGLLPPTATAPGSPPTITFDREQLDAALRRFDSGVAGLIAEGDQAVIGLDEARAWVSNTHEPLEGESQ
jgi:hypothetical protein